MPSGEGTKRRDKSSLNCYTHSIFRHMWSWPTPGQAIHCTHDVMVLDQPFRTYGLDGSGALLTRVRVALTEWDTGYQDAYEAAMTTIRGHPFIPSLLDTFLTSKVSQWLYCVTMAVL